MTTSKRLEAGLLSHSSKIVASEALKSTILYPQCRDDMVRSR